MPLTDWRLHDSAVLFIQFRDDHTAAGRLIAYAAAAELARAKRVRGLVVEPRPFDIESARSALLSHHDEVADLIAASGVGVYVLVSPRATQDARHHVFALQRRGIKARRSGGREGALIIARRLTAEHWR